MTRGEKARGTRTARVGRVLAVAAASSLLTLGATAFLPRPQQAPVTARPVFQFDLPHLPGQQLTGVLVAYPPGTSSPPHHHTGRGSVVGYVLEGAVRSQVDGGPVRVYRAGESWLERPGAAHSVSENASDTEPARILAVFVADSDAELTTVDR